MNEIIKAIAAGALGDWSTKPIGSAQLWIGLGKICAMFAEGQSVVDVALSDEFKSTMSILKRRSAGGHNADA